MTNEQKIKFLSELTELSIKHGIVLEENCCCCGGMNIKADTGNGKYVFPDDYGDNTDNIIEWKIKGVKNENAK